MQMQRAVQKFLERIVVSYFKNAHDKEFNASSVAEDDGFYLHFSNKNDDKENYNLLIPYSVALKLFMDDGNSSSGVSYSLIYELERLTIAK